MPNGRPGTLIEISFLIEGTYLVVKAWRARQGNGGERRSTRTTFPPVIFLQPLNLLFISGRSLFTRDTSLPAALPGCNYCGIVMTAYRDKEHILRLRNYQTEFVSKIYKLIKYINMYKMYRKCRI